MAGLIREAVPEDLDSLCDIAERYAAETTLPLTFDPERAREKIWSLLHKDVIVLVEDLDGTLAGFVMGYVERDFTQEACAYINKFYVEKEFRGLGTSRDLIKAFESAAHSRGAKMVFSATHGDNVKLYVNLFTRSGYTVLGRTLGKEIG